MIFYLYIIDKDLALSKKISRSGSSAALCWPMSWCRAKAARQTSSSNETYFSMSHSHLYKKFVSSSNTNSIKTIFCLPEIFKDLNPEHRFLGLEI